MALNPNYVPLTPLWEVFTDKDELTFLADGYVKFFIDTQRTVGKPVYQLTGSPPNYTYTQYGFMDTDGSWRVDMNMQGAFDQVIYGYPLDQSGNVQLYFAQFYNSDGVFQFSREGFPNFFAPGGQTSTPVDINYIPNGQFRIHTDIPETDTKMLGEVRAPITDVAFGGWTFERPSASTARDFVTFQRIGSYVENPAKSPRYVIDIVCEEPHAGDTFKDLRIYFDDVNKFASDDNTFTFSVTARTVDIPSLSADLVLIKNFGTNGSSTTETILTTFDITSTFVAYYFSFDFGDNTGKIIGELNDDYIQLALRMPPNELFEIQAGDALLTPGTIINPIFNDTTTRQFLYQSLFDDKFVPLSDGSSIGLPLVLSKEGLFFDDSTVGSIAPSILTSAPFGYLEADGDQYETMGYSSDNIPYSRLQRKLMNVAGGDILPKFGTGKNFVSTFYTNSTATPLAGSLRISNNLLGPVTDFTDGAVPTGFTFSNISSGNVDTDTWGLPFGINSFYIWSKSPISTSASPPINAHTSGFTVSVIQSDPSLPKYKQIFSVVTIAATGLAGLYFSFNTVSTGYYVWYKVNGSGADPAPPGLTGIQVDLLSTWNAQEVAYATAAAISGFKQTHVQVTAASSISNSSYWNLNTSSQNYYVWYNIDNAGVDPLVIGRLPIQVNISSTDTISMVATETLLSINSRYFATPDLRGMFLRGIDNGANIDLDTAQRWSFYNDITGDNIGTYQFDQVIQIEVGNVNTTPVTYSFPNLTFGTAAGIGGSETRPINAYVNYLIKY